MLPSGYLIRPCEGGGSIIHIVDHLNLEVLNFDRFTWTMASSKLYLSPRSLPLKIPACKGHSLIGVAFLFLLAGRALTNKERTELVGRISLFCWLGSSICTTLVELGELGRLSASIKKLEKDLKSSDKYQIPVAVGVSSYEAVSLYKGQRGIASKGEAGTNWQVHKLVLYCACWLVAGIVGGLLGLGGGFILGPLFLEMGIPPQ